MLNRREKERFQWRAEPVISGFLYNTTNSTNDESDYNSKMKVSSIKKTSDEPGGPVFSLLREELSFGQNLFVHGVDRRHVGQALHARRDVQVEVDDDDLVRRWKWIQYLQYSRCRLMWSL